MKIRFGSAKMNHIGASIQSDVYIRPCPISSLPGMEETDMFVCTGNRANSIQRLFEYGDDPEADTLLEYLSGCRKVTFAEQLKKYLYSRFRDTFDVPFAEILESQYAALILDSFEKNEAPFSFSEVKRKASGTVKSWLRAANASRGTVFLLGFGLDMEVETVSEFLTKVIRETDFDLSDPYEVIFRYCYQHHLSFAKAVKMITWYEDGLPLTEEQPESDDGDLQMHLVMLKSGLREHSAKAASYEQFMKLIDRTRRVAAQALSRDPVAICGSHKSAGEITTTDLERMISVGIPVTEDGNLIRSSASSLGKLFDYSRITRQRLNELIAGKRSVSRNDLITLLFYIYADMLDMDPEKRFTQFRDEMNTILKESGMYELYCVNPYEAFLCICLCCGCPLGTYADTLELSFQK